MCLDRTYFTEIENWKHCSKIIFNVWIVIWDPFLIKKLIKNEICGSVNSAYVHCSLQKVSICDYCSLNSNRNTPRRVITKNKNKNKNKKKKKKKKEQNAAWKRRLGIQTHTILMVMDVQRKSNWIFFSSLLNSMI